MFSRLSALNPRPNRAVKSADNLAINCSPYPARRLPFCSASIIRRPISQQLAVISTLTLRAAARRAASSSATMPPWIPA